MPPVKSPVYVSTNLYSNMNKRDLIQAQMEILTSDAYITDEAEQAELDRKFKLIEEALAEIKDYNPSQPYTNNQEEAQAKQANDFESANDPDIPSVSGSIG